MIKQLLALVVLLTATPAFALDAATEAEYHRLAAKLENLSERNVWTGAERTYQSMAELGIELSFKDHFQGAQAARAVGDVTSARVRLDLCSKMQESEEVLDWLWQVDQTYGTVHLFSDIGSVKLEAKVTPFDPNQLSAIQFAQNAVETTGTFEGLLPKGNYTFGPFDMEVQPMVSSGRVDLRTDEGMRALEKAEKKKSKKDKKNKKNQKRAR